MVRRIVRSLAGIALLVVAWADAHAVLSIRITQGIEGALPIAVVPFGWYGDGIEPPEDVGRIVAFDLERSGRFTPLPPADLPGRPDTAEGVRYSDWRLLGTENLVIGRLTQLAGGTYSVEFRLFDVFRAEQIAGLQYEVAPRDLRRAAHRIADIIYEKLTGQKGAFDTQIAYVTEWKTATGEKRYELNVADSDGLNHESALISPQPLMSPAWSPDGTRLAYVSFETIGGRKPHIFIQDLRTGSREQVASFPGINGAPSFSPDGTRLALTLSKDGNPEIYVLYLGANRLQRITNHIAIDTEPAWSPDGSSLVFTSDRGGSPQIYRVDAGGGEPKRVTFTGTYNTRATFSPDGRHLAMVHGADGQYRIALLDLQNGALSVLTGTRLDESPSFAPNGSMILYATTDAEGVALAAVSVDGRVRQRLAEQRGDPREPAWSPFRR